MTNTTQPATDAHAASVRESRLQTLPSRFASHPELPPLNEALLDSLQKIANQFHEIDNDFEGEANSFDIWFAMVDAAEIVGITLKTHRRHGPEAHRRQR